MENKLHSIPYLGNGIGFKPELKSFIFLNRDKIDFIEVIAEHYIDVPCIKLRELELLRQHFTIIPHAINLSLGSAQGIDKTYVKKLAKLVEYIDPPYWSAHISYTQAHGLDVGHLSPIVYNSEFLEILSKNISEIQSSISKPLILENITNHAELAGKEFTDADFLNTLCEKTGVGLLLDITNLFINSRNFSFDPYSFIEHLNLEKIVQCHYVGCEDQRNQLTDTHSRKTQVEIFSLIAFLLERHVPKGILLERDERFNDHGEIVSDLLMAKELLEKIKV